MRPIQLRTIIPSAQHNKTLKPRNAELIGQFLAHGDYKKVAEELSKDFPYKWRFRKYAPTCRGTRGAPRMGLQPCKGHAGRIPKGLTAVWSNILVVGRPVRNYQETAPQQGSSDLFTFAAMNIFIKIIISSLAVLLTAYLLPGIHVDDYIAALVAAAVLALLNGFLKPVLVLLTIPFTVFTLGLFLLVINAAMVMLASRFVSGFEVDGFWWALLFSIVLSVVTSIMESLGRKPINGRH